MVHLLQAGSARQGTLAVDQAGLDFLEDVRAEGPSEDVHRRELLEQIAATLSIENREILYKRFFEGRTLKEIGDEMSISQSRVSKILHRIVERLQEEIAPYFQKKLRETVGQHPLVGHIDSVGLVAGMALMKDKANKEAFPSDYDIGMVCRDHCFNNGLIMHIGSENKIAEVINKIGPEHLELNIKNYKNFVPKIKNAGSICLGKYAVMAMTDYGVPGTNHILPTNMTSKYSSGLSVSEFIKKISCINLSKKGIETLGPSVITLANYEGLEGHAQSIIKRIRRK